MSVPHRQRTVRRTGRTRAARASLVRGALLCASLFAAPSAVLADIDPARFGDPLEGGYDQAVFGFAGALTSVDMAKSAQLVGIDYEDNAVIGGGYQIFPYSIGGMKFGLEAGLAARIGDKTTAEVWWGAVARYDSIKLHDNLYVSPAFTAGFSHVSGAQPGRERDQQDADQGNARHLFYLGPEINLSFSEDAQTEVFWRLHHRSGGGRTLGNMKGAANANVIGIRYKF